MTDPRLNEVCYHPLWYVVEERATDTGFWIVRGRYTPPYRAEVIEHKFLWWEWETKFIPKFDHVTERSMAIEYARELYSTRGSDVKVTRVEKKKFMSVYEEFKYVIWENNKFYDN